MSARNNILGQRFGKLVVIQRLPELRSKSAVWLCQCDCGKTTDTTWDCLRRGTKSCGCLYLGRKNNVKHNLTGTPEYTSWAGAVQRCENKTNKAYPRYGGRGIKICERWRTSFQYFLEDMGPKPSPDMSLDRINNDGDYEPSNCRWATRTEQQNNRGSA